MAAAASSGATADRWLGTGFRFPFRPTDPGGTGGARPQWLGGMELVRQSIDTVLGTEPGERIMMPTFGCGLRRFLMAPNTVMTRTAIARDVTDALTLWEPRIRVTDVTVTPGEEPELVWIDITWVRLADLRPDNLVHPFYLR